MKRYRLLFIPAAILILFIVFTVLVKTVDVQYLPNNTYIGFYSMNHDVKNWVESFGSLDMMDKMSDVVLYLSFAFPLGYGIYFIIQLIKLKSFKLIDKRLYVLLGTYVAVVFFYFFFEIFKINYAPIESANGSFKASYPSSHVFIAVTFILCGTLASIDMLSITKILLRAATLVIMVFLVLMIGVLRLLSGQHWLSDIIASYLLAGFLISLFSIIYIDNRPVKTDN